MSIVKHEFRKVRKSYVTVLGCLHTGFITFAHNSFGSSEISTASSLGTDILRRRSVFLRGCFFFCRVKPTRECVD